MEEKKSKAVAVILWLLGGVYSAHNFYLGKYKKGIRIITVIFLYCILTGIIGSILAPILNVIYGTNLQGGLVVFSSDWLSALYTSVVQYQKTHSLLNLISLLGVTVICINLFWELYLIVTEKYKNDQKQLVFSSGDNQEQKSESEPKEKRKALRICIFGMTSFVHNFYLGRVKRGIICVVGVCLLTWIYIIGARINGLTVGVQNMDPDVAQELITNRFILFVIGSTLFIFVVWVVDFIAIMNGKIKDDSRREVFTQNK